MVKSILVHIHDDYAQDARLAVALDLARACGAHLCCVQANPFTSYVLGDPWGGFYGSTTLLDALRTSADEQRARIEQRLKSEGVTWDWTYVPGEPAQVLVSCGRLADLLILSREEKGRAEKGREDKPAPLSIVSDVAIHARAPVLVVPPEADRFRADGPVVFAWNGSLEAAHSLRLTLSLLRLATEVHIVTVSDDEIGFPPTDASRYLSRHGISSELHEWPRKGRSIAQALSDAADELNAAYIVMGAYGHSRLRETVLGGATRDLLAGATVPLLLAH